MSLTADQITAQNFKDFYNGIRPYLNGGKYHSGFTPIGTIISVMGTTAPQNYLACDGTAYNIADYPELAAYFTGQFGSVDFFGGNGTTTFAVPDLRGEFLRGTGTNSHTNQGSGASVGVHQDGTIHSNVFSYDIYIQSNKRVAKAQSNIVTDADYQYSRESSAFTTTTAQEVVDQQPSDYTSRPTNTAVLYCIATKNFVMDASCHYSTDEQVIGTWIDGSTLYQKTVDCSSIVRGGNISAGLSNVAKCVNISGVGIRSSDGLTKSLPPSNGAELNYNADFFYSVSTDKINFVSSSGISGVFDQMYATLQYTKNTD